MTDELTAGRVDRRTDNMNTIGPPPTSSGGAIKCSDKIKGKDQQIAMRNTKRVSGSFLAQDVQKRFR